MSKSRRASSPGSIGSGHRLYRLRRGAKRTRDLVSRPRPLAEGAYMCGPSSRQPGFLQLCCSLPIDQLGAPHSPDPKHQIRMAFAPSRAEDVVSQWFFANVRVDHKQNAGVAGDRTGHIRSASSARPTAAFSSESPSGWRTRFSCTSAFVNRLVC
jgi:hypothetical protein